MKTLLVIGARGQIGWELLRALAPLGVVISANRPEIDLSQPDTIRSVVRRVTPTIIINAAAYTAVDKAENEPDLAQAINGVAPGILAEEAKQLGALLVHYSTDYVFNGSAETPYTEDALPSPLNIYGRTKLSGEEAIKLSGTAHLIFRTSWVYGVRGHNFLLTMLRLMREKTEIQVVNDQIGVPMWSRTIANITAQILGKLGDAQSLTEFGGTYHITAAGQTSWFGFAQYVLSRMRASSAYASSYLTPIRTSAYPLPAVRPAYSVLSTTKLQGRFGLYTPPWEQLVDLCLADIGMG